MVVSYPFFFLNYLGPDPSPIRNRVGESESQKSLSVVVSVHGIGESLAFSLSANSVRVFFRFWQIFQYALKLVSKESESESESRSQSESSLFLCVFVFTESTRREIPRVERIGFVIESRLVPIR